MRYIWTQHVTWPNLYVDITNELKSLSIITLVYLRACNHHEFISIKIFIVLQNYLEKVEVIFSTQISFLWWYLEVQVTIVCVSIRSRPFYRASTPYPWKTSPYLYNMVVQLHNIGDILLKYKDDLDIHIYNIWASISSMPHTLIFPPILCYFFQVRLFGWCCNRPWIRGKLNHKNGQKQNDIFCVDPWPKHQISNYLYINYQKSIINVSIYACITQILLIIYPLI